MKDVRCFVYFLFKVSDWSLFECNGSLTVRSISLMDRNLLKQVVIGNECTYTVITFHVH